MADAAATAGGSEKVEGGTHGEGDSDTQAAYHYPLIFKKLWHTAAAFQSRRSRRGRYRDLRRFTYRQIKERIGRLESGDPEQRGSAGEHVGVSTGIVPGSSRRSSRYEMGRVLQTVKSGCRRADRIHDR